MDRLVGSYSELKCCLAKFSSKVMQKHVSQNFVPLKVSHFMVILHFITNLAFVLTEVASYGEYYSLLYSHLQVCHIW